MLAKVPIPSSPRQMALADDGKTLWLGFDSSSSISKFDVSNTPPVSVAVDPLPSVGSVVGLYDLAPLPGSATSIATTIGGQVAILDDGVARPTVANGRLSISALAPGPSGTLFGLDTVDSAFTFATYAISPSGVTLLGSQQGLMGNFYDVIHYSQGRVYADTGEVVDVSDPTNPVRAGKFDFSGFVAPLSPTRTLMLTSGPIPDYVQLLILENDNFTPVASLPFDSGIDGGDVSCFSDLIYLGDDGVAFLSPSTVGLGKLYIFRSPTIGTPP